LRSRVFDLLSNKVLDSSTALTGTPSLDYETMGLHYYAPHTIAPGEDYNPPHMDGGTLTILARENSECDGLEVADLETTDKMDSGGIGLEASFLPVPVAVDEVVVFLGTRMQGLLGKNTARACVHRVRAPTELTGHALFKERFSIAIFRAPPANKAK
jgi:isopenicillin N synthase-like dioxygenase